MGRITLRGRNRRECRASRGVLLPLLLMLIGVVTAPQAARAETALTGIDVSNWQGQIDWLTAASSGHAFVFAKATEGTTFTDVTFPLNRTGAALAGMRFGAYHFALPAGSSDAEVVANAIKQADHFVAVAQPQRSELLPVLDLEKTGGLSVARLSLWVQAWLSEVVARVGVKPIIYVSPSFWKAALGDSPVFAGAGHRLWIAHWTKAALPILPGANWGGLGWTFWQWSSCQRVTGINGCVDGDRLNGLSLSSVTIPAYPAGPPAPSSVPSIVGSPQAGKLLAAVSGQWAGGKPVSFSYQWQRCDAAGGGCAPISGAAAQSYTPTQVDVGHALLVTVNAAAAAGSASASSLSSPAVASSSTAPGTAPKPRSGLAIAGGAQVGQTLSALPGTWTGSPTAFSYQWRRCAPDGTACATIDRATDATYTLTPGDIGATLSLVVTALGKGGAGTATAGPTAVATAAPTPTPAVGTAFAQAGMAGAVTTSGNVALAIWQPGALPELAVVRLTDIASRLALSGTAIRLAIGAATPLPWPIDVQFASAPVDSVPGILAAKGVWQPLAELPSATLPAAQEAGTYRDSAGALHVITRTSARIALFAVGKWGDPRFTTASKPRLAQANPLTARRAADGSVILLGRITLDTQAHLYATLTAANGRKLLLTQQGSRIGWWLNGKATKTLQTLQLRPGALPIRLRIPRQLNAASPFTLRIIAIDPYGRRSSLTVAIS